MSTLPKPPAPTRVADTPYGPVFTDCAEVCFVHKGRSYVVPTHPVSEPDGAGEGTLDLGPLQGSAATALAARLREHADDPRSCWTPSTRALLREAADALDPPIPVRERIEAELRAQALRLSEFL